MEQTIRSGELGKLGQYLLHTVPKLFLPLGYILQVSVISPKEYTRFRKHNPERDGEFERRHFWTRTYVHFMLQNEIYVGSMVQGRQYTPSYRSKKREPIPKEDWVVVPDMHEPIISRELFDEAQKRLIARKKTIKAKDEPALFAGLFYCEACGTSMKLGVSQQKYFYYMCGRSQAIGTVACSSHYINRDTLYQVVQEDIQRNARLFSEDTEKAAQKLMELKCADQQKQTATMKRDLASAKKRLADLDMKLKRTYEDNMSGKLPDHIFTMFIADYDTERATLKANIAEMEKALEKVRDISFCRQDGIKLVHHLYQHIVEVNLLFFQFDLLQIIPGDFKKLVYQPFQAVCLVQRDMSIFCFLLRRHIRRFVQQA